MPMIKRAEFGRRRRKLMQFMGNNSIAILPSNSEQLRSRDTDFQFRQHSDFHYLSGFPEPQSVLVLVPGREQGEFILFCRDRDPKMETWHGRRQGPAGAMKNYKCDDAFPIDDIDDILPGLMEGRDRIYYEFGNHNEFDNKIMGWINSLRSQVKNGAHPPGELIDLSHVLHDMRLFKSSAEIAVMKQVAELSAKAHNHVMQSCAKAKNESDLEAEIKYQFAKKGARFEAYNSIVASGENACILHYVENDCGLNNKDLILIDAGAELAGYAADITRTFPKSGRFSVLQKQAYQWVLKANKEAIKTVKPGNPWTAPHDTAVRILTQGLIDMQILSGELNQLVDEEAYKPYYMHKTGHWLGLDVHDVGDYLIDKEPRILESGMVLTVEPGLYFAPNTKGLDKKMVGSWDPY
ncbi:MAG: aminopeptidase P N-terminal domain-containing protein [Enterobacterales bacterium]|nr:aminopeptidase P N-terminal domain-containing protein [Enterobacterales bacterium]